MENKKSSKSEFLEVLSGILDAGLIPREIRVRDISASFVKSAEDHDTPPNKHPFEELTKEDKKRQKEQELFYSSG